MNYFDLTYTHHIKQTHKVELFVSNTNLYPVNFIWDLEALIKSEIICYF